ncbi:hypothetical protein [Microlunatus antarcticus]|uniref:Uncharacterized protein n=1 Tax=Microlunatus antarcticus TaxID=53388 RepID=A0A7W5JUV2_9ACTN|nr:hypothetical protein [Microlunatus antarcticus]MBB3326784.1 hypothetical protein [Microlunatus antarcticus]
MSDTARCCLSDCDNEPAFSLSAVHTSTISVGHEQTVCADHLAEVVVTLDEYLLEWNPLDTLYVAHLCRRPLSDEDIDRGNAAMSAAQDEFYAWFDQLDLTETRTG